MHAETLRKPVARCPGGRRETDHGPRDWGQTPEFHLAEASVLFHRLCLFTIKCVLFTF